MRLIDADMIEPHEQLEPLGNGKYEFALVVYMDDIDALPSVDAVPARRGKWKAVTEDGEVYKRICSCCGKEAPFDETERVYLIYPHCPWCGAKMGVDGK